MALRVAQIGTGNVGRHALTALITNPDYELTGVWVSSDAKSGKDAGELGYRNAHRQRHPARRRRSGRYSQHTRLALGDGQRAIHFALSRPVREDSPCALCG